ncbi:MAG: exodeoxyribonuclease VII large subunit [Coriobacteriaceae bacterium]|nr:exodeoxyribonuclease VII large subunit [Coriobacteriaceae bacterium]
MSETLSVSQALNLAKGSLEKVSATIVGEISEYSDKPGYKAVYFTITDKSAALPCMMWRSVFDKLDLALKQGMLVEVSGFFSVYIAKGRMNFSAQSMRLAGEGDLRLKVAQLARKLEAEGLMSPTRKLPLPAMPTKVAVVTSPRGKAIHDVLRTLRRRFPLAEVQVVGVPVEGDAAPKALIEGIEVAQQAKSDVILLVRGGGSYEDLMPFNDEALARAIVASSIPVVTGIGHEPDNSIADMVSSYRASTPTAAAEHVVPDIRELKMRLANQGKALSAALTNRVERLDNAVVNVRSRALFTDPLFLVGDHLQNLEQSTQRLSIAIPNALRSDVHQVEVLKGRLARIVSTLTSHQQSRLQLLAAQLESLSPLAVLARGYSIAYDDKGYIVDSVYVVEPGDTLDVHVSDGDYHCRVEAKTEKDRMKLDLETDADE